MNVTSLCRPFDSSSGGFRQRVCVCALTSFPRAKKFSIQSIDQTVSVAKMTTPPRFCSFKKILEWVFRFRKELKKLRTTSIAFATDSNCLQVLISCVDEFFDDRKLLTTSISSELMESSVWSIDENALTNDHHQMNRHKSGRKFASQWLLKQNSIGWKSSEN